MEREESARTRKGRRSRRATGDAAHTLFLNRGYHGTSVRDIAEAGGLTIGRLHAHWPDKESIWSAVLDTYHPLRRLVPVFDQIEADSLESLFAGRDRPLVLRIDLLLFHDLDQSHQNGTILDEQTPPAGLDEKPTLR